MFRPISRDCSSVPDAGLGLRIASAYVVFVFNFSIMAIKDDFNSLILHSICCITSLLIAFMPLSSCSILFINQHAFSLARILSSFTSS